MPAWINRTALSGSSTAANGTNSHTCTFTAATAGNFLVAVVGGSVTFTTPAGWTLVVSAVNNCGLYVFTKTASSGESSFSTTHNGSDYAIQGIVYEYYTGTSSIGSNSSTATGGTTGPQVTSLTGTYTTFTARTQGDSSGTTTTSSVWTVPSTEDYDAVQSKGTNDGVYLTVAYDDNQTGTSFNPATSITTNSGTTFEGVAFALSVATPVTTTPEVATNPVTSVGTTTATGNGAINSDGGATVTERGFVWGTAVNPTTADSKVTAAGTTGSYNASLTGLSSGTLYHVRAYATNANGTAYGIDVVFRNLGTSINWVKAA